MEENKNKYYFINYKMRSLVLSKKISDHQCVSDEHPFDWLKLKNKLWPSLSTSELTDWKEITKDEYLKGKEVIGIG